MCENTDISVIIGFPFVVCNTATAAWPLFAIEWWLMCKVETHSHFSLLRSRSHAIRTWFPTVILSVLFLVYLPSFGGCCWPRES